MATQADLSGISYFLPILSFFVVFVIIYAVLSASKIIGDKWVKLFVSFLVSTIFVSAVGARDYVLNIIPWFAVLIVSLFLMMMVTGFIGKMDKFNHGLGIAFVVLLILAFLVSAIFVFSDYFAPYIPRPTYGAGGNPSVLNFTEWFYSGRVMGGILLLILSGLVSWILVKSK